MVSDRVTLGNGSEDVAIQNTERGVQSESHQKLLAILDRANWDDLQVISGAAGASSLRKAAIDMRISVNTVRARLDRLEQAIGSTLFARTRDGLKITAEGRVVLQIVREMRLIGTGLPLGQGNNALVRDGEVRLCVSEGIGTFWLTPRLVELKSRLADLTVSLDSFADQNILKPNEYDISVGFIRPKDDEVIVTRLATVHIIPFASEQYLRQHGTPQSLDDLSVHQYVHQDAPGMHNDAIELFFGSEMLRHFVAIRVSSSYSLFWAVASGVGVGVLPTYARAISKRVIPINLPIQMKFELWASYSRTAKHSKPVRTTLQWLRDSFDPVRYPWFRDTFVHPDDFGDGIGDSQVIPIFDHLIDDNAGTPHREDLLK